MLDRVRVPWAVGVRSANVERARELAAAVARARVERNWRRNAAPPPSVSGSLANSRHPREFAQRDDRAGVAGRGAPRRDPAAAARRSARWSARQDRARETGRLLRLIEDGATTSGPSAAWGGDLPALADEYMRAGLGIDLEVDDVMPALPIGVELSSYRIVQEALTNALKHAPGSPVHIRLAREGADVAIEVRNGAHPRRRSASSPADTAGRAARASLAVRRSTRCRSDSRRRVRPGRDPAAGREPSMTSVVLADDQELLRGGLRALLKRAASRSLAEAGMAAKRSRPPVCTDPTCS